ncbi:MAG: Wzz/FepE/Etk N-terminal domain-containing protein [Peptococcaceae bacterium]|nr:Wzz/FepE/Etk N-terminal domain-containing protein [Peptococcaceae bacterium]
MTNWNKYFKMIFKKMWFVITITLIFVLVASYITLYVVKPQYQASARLFVMINNKDNPNAITYDDLLAAQLLVTNYKELIQSRTVTSEVIYNLNLTNMTDQQLASSIDVQVDPNSSMFDILVQHENPNLDLELANEVSAVFIQKASELLKINNISLVDAPTVSSTPVYPRTKLVIAFSFLAGIIISLGIILVMVYFDDSVQDTDEMENKTGIHVIGIIPDMKIR